MGAKRGTTTDVSFTQVIATQATPAYCMGPGPQALGGTKCQAKSLSETGLNYAEITSAVQ